MNRSGRRFSYLKENEALEELLDDPLWTNFKGYENFICGNGKKIWSSREDLKRRNVRVGDGNFRYAMLPTHSGRAVQTNRRLIRNLEEARHRRRHLDAFVGHQDCMRQYSGFFRAHERCLDPGVKIGKIYLCDDPGCRLNDDGSNLGR